MQLKPLRDGYVRCETLVPLHGCFILQHPDMPTRRAMALLTEEGPLALSVSAESAQWIAGILAKAAADMRKAS